MASNLPQTQPKPPLEDEGQARFRGLLISLAREIAMELEGTDAILVRKGISKDQYEKIVKNPFYARVLEAETDAWRSGLNAEQRLKIQSAFLIENALPSYYLRITDKAEPLSGVNEGMKTLAKFAGIGDRQGAAPEGGKFVISINLGAGKLIEHEVKTIEATPTKEITSESPK